MKKWMSFTICICMLGCKNTPAPPAAAPRHSDYVISLPEMHKVDVGDGETVYQAEGKNHNMPNMSFVITATQPGGGPPLHSHPTEEAHVVLSGTVTYIIADSVLRSARLLLSIYPLTRPIRSLTPEILC